jgi:hypothetical protein
MPGSSSIFGVLPCTNRRVLDHEHKPWTYTYDIEAVIGEDEEGEVQSVLALLHYFVPVDAYEPTEGKLHYVYRKLASMEPSMPVGDGN